MPANSVSSVDQLWHSYLDQLSAGALIERSSLPPSTALYEQAWRRPLLQ